MRRTAVLLGVLAVLAVPAGAGAKEIGSLTLCGAGACHGVRGEDARRAFMDSSMTAAPARAEPFLQLRVRIREGEDQIFGFSVRWLPGANAIRTPDGRRFATWTR